MFTGIIENIGTLAARTPQAGGARLHVTPRTPVGDVQIGESIANNGVCLTVEPGSTPSDLQFFLSGESLSRTTLGSLPLGAQINLERAMSPQGRLGGHLVMGHVDGVGKLTRFEKSGQSWILEVEYPADLAPMIAPKGSIAVNGISLTVVEVTASSFTVAVIPHTADQTNLPSTQTGQSVNLEVDMLARYVVHALGAMRSSQPRVTLDLLGRAGFLE